MLRLHLDRIDAPDTTIQEIDQQVTALITRMDREVVAGQATFQGLIVPLIAIPGVDVLSARIILPEIMGSSLHRWPGKA